MDVVERGVVSAAVPGTSRAFSTFPAFVVLADGSLLITYSIGTGKDTDDLDIELRRSTDGGRTWTDPENPFETTIQGRRGSLKAAPITRLDGDHLIVAGLWIDREAFPGQPLFNPETEGCLPMTVLLADSPDAGRTWTPWRIVPMPHDIGPPSLTNAVLRLADGRLVLSIESNKPYLDASKWFQRVVHLRSSDGGTTWSEPVTVCEDPTGRIANWDQRGAIAPDGRLVTFTWTYDTESATYLNVRRRISADGIAPLGPPEDLGFADQPGHPAVLADGRVVLAWVDRFGTASIRARQAAAIDAPFDPASEVVIHDPGTHRTHATGAPAAADATATGEILVDMGTWSYGLAFAEALPDGDVGVVHYAAGERGGTDVRWARVRPER
jgi:BNR repeat-like domain